MPLLNAIRLGFLIAATPLIALGSSAPPRPPEPPLPSIVKAVSGDNGDVWLLGEDGSIFTIEERVENHSAIALPERAQDLCEGSTPVALTTSGNASTGWMVRRWRNGKWTAFARIVPEGDEVVGLACDGNDVALLTSKRLIQIDANGERVVKLSGDLHPALVNSTLLSTPEAIYLGQNKGEWGGGLSRIDRRNGRIAAVESNVSNTLCGGPLNGGCDPVNGLVRDPWKPGCIIASIGLVHMAPHGRIVEVCGTNVRRLYFRVHPEAIKYEGAAASKPQGDGDDEPFSTEAFYGIVARGNDVWVAGTAGLYHFTSTSDPKISDIPPFHSIAGIRLSKAVPGLTLILTDINGKASVGGAVPLMVATGR
jgi:hypothetical protein